MKKKKRYVVILLILIAFTIGMYFAFGRENIAKSKDATTIIVGDSTIWNYSDNKWLNVTNSKTIESLNWLDYNVYLDNKKLGKYYLWNDGNKWFIFDASKKAINKEGTILAFRSNYDIKVKSFDLNPIRNYYHVNKVLKENKLSTSSVYTVSEEITIDLDSDGQNETLYFASNAFALDFNPEKVFSFVFMVKNSQIYPIYTDVDKNTGTNGCKPYLSAIMDIDNDNIYELVVSCGRYSVNKPVDMLYKFNGNEFKILITNQ